MFESNYLYATDKGKAIVGDSFELMKSLPSGSVNLVFTSPPFPLLFPKEYGNRDQREYIDWLLAFTEEVQRIVADDGSFVLDLGGAYQKGVPIRSLYNFRLLLRMCDEQGWKLAQEFFLHNPAKLPSPIEWVNRRKIRAKDSVNTLWWLVKAPFPKADIRAVLTEYSDSMKKLLQRNAKPYTPKLRPSGHYISEHFMTDNGGAIPSNLLQIPNTESNSHYLRACKLLNVKIHPARFPAALPEFFIRFLTSENDLVLDIFAGSNTMGRTAQQLNRHWISFELEHQYLAASSFRFLEHMKKHELESIYQSLLNNRYAEMHLDQLYVNSEG